MKKSALLFLLLGLILSYGPAFGADQLVIVYDDGSSQTVSLKGPTYGIRSIHFQGDAAAATPPSVSGNRIQVVAGTYGRNCGASHGNKTEHLARACDGKSRCEYTINYQVIGDPVVGCGKDYTAEWHCGDSSRVHRTSASPEAGFGKKIVLSCPQ
ncbi:MAG: hypothetical protein HPY65_03220 [Syntrophaceae bacterium]|nr:hypothetical protein [Syntrophaceae bacterium]